MHLLASASIVIHRPREAVFEYIADLENFARWFPGVASVASRDRLPPGNVGKAYEESLVSPMRGSRPVQIRVREAQPPGRFVTEGSLAVLLPRMEIDLHEAGERACEVRWRMFSRSEARIVRWAVLPLVRRVLQKRADAAMPRLKALLEAVAPAGAPRRQPHAEGRP